MNFHPYYDCKRIAEEFDEEKERAADFLMPRYKALGDDVDDAGALAVYEKHRIIERRIADFYYYEVAPFAESVQRMDIANNLRATALKLYQCRTGGPFGIGTHGRPVVAWDKKCGCSKLCPDEARAEAQRLYDRYAQAIVDHVKAGGRVYKVWPTLPNYPAGRLREGKRHIFKRYRDKIVRAQLGKQNKFGHVGSLVIQEDPKSAHDDWNVHLNGIILSKGFLSYKELRAAWGCNIEIRQHKMRRSPAQLEHDLHALFNEMIKYPVITVAEKSQDKATRHVTDAPALTDWTPAEVIEWHEANHGFRRTRAYGSLHGIGKPDRPNVTPTRWLGRLDWQPDGYKVTWRKHNLAFLVDDMLTWDRRALDLIRGDNSTTVPNYQAPRGPP